MEYKIIGDDFQIVNVNIAPGEKFFAEAGAMVYASGNVHIESKAKGGVKGIFKRFFSGESAFLTEYTTTGDEGIVAFGKHLGKIIPIKLNEGEHIIAKMGTYIAATEGISIEITTVGNIGSGLFGGKGFLLQKIKSNAPNQVVFLEATGQVITFDLEEGQMIKVDSGNSVAFEPSVDYNIQKSGNLKTMFMGGEGLFLTTLKGPGRVWIQSVCLAELIAKFSFKKKK